MVEFRDVRIIALGVLYKPRSSFSVNQNAKLFLHPPGMTKSVDEVASASTARSISENSDESFASSAADPLLPVRAAPRRSTLASPRDPESSTSGVNLAINLRDAYRQLTHPLPSSCHANYPFYTPGGEDKRWMGNEELEEGGRQWVGPMLCVPIGYSGCRISDTSASRITAQLIGPQTKEPFDENPPPTLQDLDLVNGPGRNQYASLSWADLTAIAPWLELTNMINGPGLGH